MGIGKAMRQTGGSQKQYKQVSAPIALSCTGTGPEYHHNQAKWSICHSLMGFCAVAYYIILMNFSYIYSYLSYKLAYFI